MPASTPVVRAAEVTPPDMDLFGSLFSRAVQLAQRLPPPSTRDVVVERDLEVPMRDGAVLQAERWSPRTGGDGLPVALLRSPYARAGWWLARPLAERGFQVVVQSVRGTFGSAGSFDPFRQERDDGLDTLDWILGQPWFGGSIVLVGFSYLGHAQWAVADEAPPEVKAMVPAISESALTLEFLRPDGFSLETPFAWGVLVAGQERRFAPARQLLGQRRLRRALRTLPLGRADRVALGRRDDYLQNILAHDGDDPFWADADHRHRVADVAVPASLVGGWYDLFLPGQLRDYRALQEAGREARLTVGPWTHGSLDVNRVGTREALGFGLAHARGGRSPERAPVRLFVMGQGAWRDFGSWPPPGYHGRRFHLRDGGGLSCEQPRESAPDRYRYDPADPTPAVGGARLSLVSKAGRVDNAKLEARPDVLTYTTEALQEDVEVIGDIEAEVWFRSSLPHADVFVRLCDVDAGGRSHNVCDGLTSITGADATSRVTVELWPTAHRFGRGHRIRVQVSSGAFPRYNRNPGTGEPRATAAALRVADQLVFHDPERPSAVILPIRRAQPTTDRGVVASSDQDRPS